MDFNELYDKIKKGEISREDAKEKISFAYIETAGKSILDVNRDMRTGIPEIVYGEYKTLEQVVDIAENLLTRDPLVIISRFKENDKLNDILSKKYPVIKGDHIFVAGNLPKPVAPVLVISGGAADHPITEEVEITLKSIATEPLVFEDRGIAHPTRVLEALKEGISRQVKSIVVIAGMEGALATFVSSFVSLPVIGVPTSVGYGVNAKDSALTSMLSSCTPNLAVVNIDGGVRAAVIAGLIAKNSL
ncbi:nickel pincer cofactor biosynthesis protein LarB [Bacteroidota bacterium]